MKKLISVLICISILLSVVPMVSQAVDVTTPVFIDFEDFEGNDNKKYKDGYIEFALASENYQAPVIDSDHGKSIEIITSGSMNLYSRLTQNAVFGFSYYSTDTNAGFAVSSKASNSSKTNEGWVDADAFLKVDGSSIKLGSTVLESNTYTKGTWVDFAFGMDYTNHEIDLYIDGKYITTYKTGKDGFKGTDRFLFGTIANRTSDSDSTKGAAHYFDNMFVYYPPDSVTAGVSGIPGDSAEKDEITVDFGQNVILPSDSSYVTLNGDEVEAEPVVNYGYVTGLKIKNLSLLGDTKYTVAFPGVTDFLGNSISEYEFTTDVTAPKLSISCKNPDAAYGEDDIAEFEIESAFLNGSNIDIYHNGEVCQSLNSNAKEFSVQLAGGNNEIYAKVAELNLESQKVSIYIDNTPVINIACQNADAVYEVGDSVKFSISNANLKGNAIDIYNNGTKVDTISADAGEFTVELVGGNNEICAKVSALDAKSQTITILAETMGPIIDEVTFFDFEDGKTGGVQLDKYDGNISVVDTEDEHGNSLYFYHDDGEVTNKPRVIVEKFTDKKGIYSFEADFKFSRVDERTAILPIIYKTNQGNNGTIALYVLENGELLTGSTKICEVKPNVWYNFRATWNSDTKKSDFYVNGAKVASDVDFSKYNDFASFVYVNVMMVHKKGETSYMYMDNIKSCFLAKMANAEAVFQGSDASEVPYENTVITFEFDQAMNPDSLKDIKLTSDIGNVILIDFESDDNFTFTANVASLSPNTNYTIDLSSVVAEVGVGVSSETVSFKTQKAPFAIKGVKTSVTGDNLKVDVSIQNNNSEEKSYIVIVALYHGNMMLSSDAKAYTSSKPEVPSFTFAEPYGDYDIEVYVFDSAEKLNLIDFSK